LSSPAVPIFCVILYIFPWVKGGGLSHLHHTHVLIHTCTEFTTPYILHIISIPTETDIQYLLWLDSTHINQRETFEI
jgi:hypothetical protein